MPMPVIAIVIVCSAHSINMKTAINNNECFVLNHIQSNLFRYHQSTEILIDLDLFGFVISCAITFTDGAQQHSQLTSSIETPSSSTSVASSKFIYSRNTNGNEHELCILLWFTNNNDSLSFANI